MKTKWYPYSNSCNRSDEIIRKKRRQSKNKRQWIYQRLLLLWIILIAGILIWESSGISLKRDLENIEGWFYAQDGIAVMSDPGMKTDNLDMADRGAEDEDDDIFSNNKKDGTGITEKFYEDSSDRYSKVSENAEENSIKSQYDFSDYEQDGSLMRILGTFQEIQIPQQLRELAERNPETVEFVKQYPKLHNEHSDIDLTQEATGDHVPLLMQWDTRWGYESYGTSYIACAGCGPTCLSMVLLYLTGNTEYSPLTVARYAEANGYYITGQGTSWDLMRSGAAYFGLDSREISLSETQMKRVLDQGLPIICSVGPGDFTTEGHFIVIIGYTDEGFTVNDPNSILRSEMIWSFDRLKRQIKNLWSFRKI